jgi:SAM-dependent methyltransferase
VLHGSAEHLPLPDASVDVIHARFAYFFPPGCDAGLAEAIRVLRPGGSLVVVDNDKRHGQFAQFLRASPWAAYQGTVDGTDAWWGERGATRVEVMSDWRFERRQDLEAVLGLEFPPEVTADWLRAHPHDLTISYGYVLFAVRKP